ncbi:MAG: hypothetical protein VB046_08400 [Paludibacter sp.]|nr:hypothetical protein [Paludibacter sp.]
MIQIIDIETKKRFDLPDGIKISIEETNQFISDKGSSSLPLSFPWTDNNLKLLNFPHRFDRIEKYITRRNVIVSNEMFQKSGILVISSARKGKNIAGTILFNESALNFLMKDVTMQQVFSSVVREDYDGNLNERVESWIDHFEKVMAGYLDDDFHVFQVCFKLSGVSAFEHKLLNEQNPDDMNSELPGVDPFYRLKNRIAGSFVDEDNVTIYYPAGYRVTGFLKLSYVLHRIFEYFGYNLTFDFDADTSLKSTVILNKTSDLLLPGKIRYDQMVPTMTVSEFVNIIRTTYNVEFIPSSYSADIDMVRFDDNNQLTDITPYQSDYPLIEFEQYKTLNLTCEKSLEVKNSQHKTWQDFNASFSNIIEESRYEQLFNPYGQYIFIRSIGLYYEKKNTVDGLQISKLGYNNFDYCDKITDHVLYEKKCGFEYVSMIILQRENVNPLFNPWLIPIPYIGAELSLNSTIRVEGKTDADKSTTDCPVMLCFAMGRGNGTEYNKYAYASSQRYDNAGVAKMAYNLAISGTNGLYEKNWITFNDILKYSFQPVTVPLKLDPYQILNYEISRKKLLNGQPLLPESLKYEITESGVNIIEAKFRTMKLYE